MEMTKYIIKKENKYLYNETWIDNIDKATLFCSKGGAKCAMKKHILVRDKETHRMEEQKDFWKNAIILELTMEIINSKIIDN